MVRDSKAPPPSSKSQVIGRSPRALPKSLSLEEGLEETVPQEEALRKRSPPGGLLLLLAGGRGTRRPGRRSATSGRLQELGASSCHAATAEKAVRGTEVVSLPPACGA